MTQTKYAFIKLGSGPINSHEMAHDMTRNTRKSLNSIATAILERFDAVVRSYCIASKGWGEFALIFRCKHLKMSDIVCMLTPYLITNSLPPFRMN